MTRPWESRGACLKASDRSVFFPEDFGGRQGRRIALAKAFCKRCSVVTECLELALSQGISFGIFGGTTAQERTAMTTYTTNQEVAL